MPGEHERIRPRKTVARAVHVGFDEALHFLQIAQARLRDERDRLDVERLIEFMSVVARELLGERERGAGESPVDLAVRFRGLYRARLEPI